MRNRDGFLVKSRVASKTEFSLTFARVGGGGFGVWGLGFGGRIFHLAVWVFHSKIDDSTAEVLKKFCAHRL